MHCLSKGNVGTGYAGEPPSVQRTRYVLCMGIAIKSAVNRCNIIFITVHCEKSVPNSSTVYYLRYYTPSIIILIIIPTSYLYTMRNKNTISFFFIKLSFSRISCSAVGILCNNSSIARFIYIHYFIIDLFYYNLF